MRLEMTLALFTATLAQPSRAQTQNDWEKASVEAVLVTASKNPLALKELGASVIVLLRDDIELSGASTVSEILRGLPGLVIRRTGAAGSNAEILIRGDKGGHTLILIDGIEQADVTSIEKNYDVGEFPLHEVERIEIIKGPHSIAYGASGLSGVVHIITRRPQNGLGSSAGLNFGSDDSYGSQLRLTGRQGSFSYGGALAGKTTRGYSHTGSRDHAEADGLTRSDSRLWMRYEPLQSYKADLVIQGSQTLADLDAGADSDDANYQSKSRELSAQLAQKFQVFGNSETGLIAALSQSDRRYHDDRDPENPNRDQTWERSRYQGERRTLEVSQLVPLAANQSALLSAQWTHDSAEIRNLASYQGFAVDNALPQQTIKEFSYALQYQWGLWDRVSGQCGIRTLNPSKFGKKTVGQAAFNILLIPEWTTLRLNYGRGYKTPSLYQLRAPIYGNDSLRPEFVITAEASIEQKLSRDVSGSITGFQNQSLNLIEFDSNASRYYNIKSALIEGMESRMAWELSPEIAAQVQYTRLKTLDREIQRPLPSRPDETWGGDVTWKDAALQAMLAFRGQTRSRAQPYVAGTAGFRVLDTAFGWRRGATRFSLRVNNLLNSWYQEVAGYNAAGRNFAGSADFSF